MMRVAAFRYPTCLAALVGIWLATAAGCDMSGNEAAPSNAAIQAVYVSDETFQLEVYESAIPVLVDFTATWCAPCKEVDPIVDELAAEMAERAKVVKLDIDESPNIYQQLRVNGIPTVIFFNQGREEDRISGPQQREIYAQYLTTMIDGGDMLDTRLELLQGDDYRRHFLVSRELDDIRAIIPHRPDLLVEPFADGQTPLTLALRRPSIRQEALIELILSHEPAIGTYDLIGIGRCDEFLAAVEADPNLANEPDAGGATPLRLALMGGVRERNDECARALLDAGAVPDGDSSVYLPKWVMFYQDADLLRTFLERGMDPGETDELGRNALHLAAMYGYYPLAELLLEHGMDPTARNGDGATAAEMVRSQQERRAERWNERGMMDTPEQQAALREYNEQSTRLLELLESTQT